MTLEIDDGYASYLWQDGSTNNTYQVTNGGTYWVRVTNEGGCEASDTVQINFLDSPVVDLGPDQGFCEGDTITLEINEGYASYLWQDGTTNNTYQVTEGGTYWVNVISQNGCENSDTVHIFNDTPVVDLGPDQELCDIDTLTLEIKEGYASYLWQDSTTGNTYHVKESGTYWVSVTSQGGCMNSDTVKINFLESPVVFLGNDTTLLYGDSLILNAGPGEYDYTWQDGSIDQRFTVTEDGTYWVRVSNGACDASDTINVEFRGNCQVFVPNVFTPNTDGYNDEFFASFNEQVADFHMSVFNRWGMEMMETSDMNYHWDGKYKSQLVPKGVYYWIVEYYCYGSLDKQILKGSVTVIY